MNIPNFIDIPVVDKDGVLTPTWRQILMQLITQLQENVGNEGFSVPQLPTTSIAQLTKSPNGTIIYDSTIDQTKIKTGGTFKTVTVT